MNKTQRDLNAKPATGRKNWRLASVIAGLIAVAVAATVIVEERGGNASTRTNASGSNVAPLAAGPAEDRAAAPNTASDAPATRPHFERSDEPAVEDTVHPYGG